MAPLEIYHDFMEERFQLPPFYINNQQVAIEYNEFTDTYHVKENPLTVLFWLLMNMERNEQMRINC